MTFSLAATSIFLCFFQQWPSLMDYVLPLLFGMAFGLFQRLADDLSGLLSIPFGGFWGLILSYYLQSPLSSDTLAEYYGGIVAFWLYSGKIDSHSHLLGFLISLLAVKGGIVAVVTFFATLFLHKVAKGMPHVYLPMGLLAFLGTFPDLLFAFSSATTAILLKRWKHGGANP